MLTCLICLYDFEIEVLPFIKKGKIEDFFNINAMSLPVSSYSSTTLAASCERQNL